MTASELFGALARIAGLLFIVTSMMAMGMSLTMIQILQPLKNARLVALALLSNFVLVPGVSVNPWDIARSLIFLMLILLAIGLLFKSHSPESADHWQPVTNRISGLAILILLVVGLGLNISNILSLIGTGGIVALLPFIVGSLLILLPTAKRMGARSQAASPQPVPASD